jgi:hypothetical protein
VEWAYTPILAGTSDSVPAETKVVNKENVNLIRKRTSFEGNPRFKSKAELNIYIDETKHDAQQLNTPQLSVPAKTFQITVMPNKYGLTGGANWITLNSAMWAYPNDKRKSAVVPIHIDCADGTKVCYTLHRGKISPIDVDRGQLSVSHCKIIMVVVNLWQQQGCKLSGSCAVVDCTIADILSALNYNFSGYKL